MSNCFKCKNKPSVTHEFQGMVFEYYCPSVDRYFSTHNEIADMDQGACSDYFAAGSDVEDPEDLTVESITIRGEKDVLSVSRYPDGSFATRMDGLGATHDNQS